MSLRRIRRRAGSSMPQGHGFNLANPPRAAMTLIKCGATRL
jgi:hypothetical protein